MNDILVTKRLLGEGGSAEVYEIGDGKILKLFKKTTSTNTIRHEYNNVSQLNSKGLPMPQVYSMVEEDGRLGIVYELAPGTTMTELVKAKPWKAKELAVRLAELHKSIHIPIDTELYNVKGYLRCRISLVRRISEEDKEKIYLYLDSLPDGNTLCHGDFHFNNILLHENKAAVIDWMDAVKGCQFFDVARSWVLVKYPDIPKNTNFLIKHIAKSITETFQKNYLNHYIKITKCKREQIDEWVLPAAAARLSEGISENVKDDIYKIVKKLLKGKGT